MMKPLIATALAILFAVSSGWAFTACDRNDEPTTTVPGNTPTVDDGIDDNNGNTPDDNDDDNDNPETPDAMTLNMKIGNSTFTVTLADNATAQAFATLLPLSLNMSELNGNEKYIYLDQSLPSQPTSPGTIQTGDLMLYGSTCIVLFYESFSTSYRYTRIGRVDNPAGLAAAVGSGSVTVSFEH